MREALLYLTLPNKKVHCEACYHFCVIEPGKTGICGVRQNQDGRLFSLVYGHLVAQQVDPIEKKPFYHFLPGSQTYSIATVGCNFKCLNCQNASISQIGLTVEARGAESKLRDANIPQIKLFEAISGTEVAPLSIVNAAQANDCASIAYTYTEPTIFVEFAWDTMKLAREAGLKNVWVSNGYFSEKTLALILPYLNAINVDLKFFNDASYQEICGARLAPVLDNLKRLARASVHLEITTLIIPGLNDSDSELQAMAQFIYQLNPEIPWHLSAFHPAYKLSHLPITPRATLENVKQIALAIGLKRVYLGNI